MTADPFDSGGFDDDFEVNLGKVGGRPPAGSAIVELAQIKKQVSQSGNPMWVFEFKIIEYRQVDGEGEASDWIGEVLPVFCALTPNAMWKLAETVGALGIDVPADDRVARFKSEDVIGVQALAALKHTEFNGRETTSIDALRALDTSAGSGSPVSSAATGDTENPADVF